MDGIAQVAALGISDRLFHLLIGHGAGDRRLISGIAVDNRRVYTIRIIKGNVSRIVFHSRATLGVHIMNRQFEDVLLIVYLDDVLRFNRADGQRELLCLIKDIAGGALVSIPSYLAVEVRFVRFGQAVVLRTVNVVFNSVAVLIDGIIEDNLLIIRIQLEGLGCGINCGVTGHVDGFLGHGAVKGLAANNLIFLHLLRGALFVVVHGVGNVGVRLPDGIKDVLALAVYLHHISASFDGAAAVGRGIPAHESIANAGEGVFDGGNGGVVGDGVNRLFRFRAIIGHIGQGDGCGTSAPHASEGHVVLDLILVAGLVDSTSAILPTEEVLVVIRDQLIGSLQVGIAILRVGLTILRKCNTRRTDHTFIVFAQDISYGEGAILRKVRIEGDIAIDFGVDIKGLTAAVLFGAPATPGIARMGSHDRFLKVVQLFSIKRFAIRNFRERLTTIAAIDRNKCLAHDSRRNPTSVNRYVLCRHGLTGENELVTAFRSIIPAYKFITRRHTSRSVRRIFFTCIRDACLIFIGLFMCLGTVVDINNIVAVAGIIELSAIILASILGAFFCIAREARDRIAVFLSHSRSTRRTLVRMIKHIFAI